MRNLALALVALGACSGDEVTEIRMDFDRDHFYDAPFPAEDLRKSDGTIDLSAFPNPDNIGFVSDIASLIDGQLDGFGTTSAIYFSATGALDGTGLPTIAESVADTSAVFLFSIDASDPDYRKRIPLEVLYEENGGPFGTANQLSLLPLQGVPLRPRVTYVAAVMRSLGTAEGEPIAQSDTMTALAAGESSGMIPLDNAAAELTAAGVDLTQVAGMTVFTTQAPGRELGEFVTHARTQTTPTQKSAFVRTELYPDFCVYESSVDMPVYQQGTPPFSNVGGGWPATPAVQATEEARIIVTIPRVAAPSSGYLTAVMIRTGGGGDRPLVDRGHRATAGGEGQAGGGPALHFARAGLAGVSVDGPHGGMRNVTMGDEQFLIFNISNPNAIRDNIRQSALEIALVPEILANVTIDLTDCPGASASGALFDGTRMALMGHSMGATIAPLVFPNQPIYQAAILSGAGGSWTQNIVHKKSPFEIRPIAESLLGYGDHGRKLNVHDVAVNLFQWAVESADPPAYGRSIIHESSRPVQVLMFQGIVDTYILPSIANATSLSLGLDLAGDKLDEVHPDLTAFTPLAELLGFVGRDVITLPASGNLLVDSQSVTGVVVQHPSDPIEDGHEVMFQRDDAKLQYQTFLSTWASGIPTVPLAN